VDKIIIIDKPKGITSHDVVDFVRRRLKMRKVGHAGTLDPMATGVLVILTGSCTKRSDEFLNGDKEYECELTLGARSDTGDAEGKIVSSGISYDIKPVVIEKAFKAFLGTIDQVPPAYSAVRHNGKKLYELARKGIFIKKEPRKITIKKLEITGIALPKVFFKVACSKGTYVRQLACDIGEALGCGAYLSALRRTRSGSFGIEEAIAMDSVCA